MKGLSGKRAIVTGGGSGIGRKVCERFGEEGAEVFIFDLNENGGRETANTIQGAGGTATSFQVDISQEAAVRDAVAAIEQTGPIDILVNNAGWDQMSPFLQTEPALW